MDPMVELRRWVDAPDPRALVPATLWLARGVDEVQRTLDPVLTDPVDRALAGLAPLEQVEIEWSTVGTEELGRQALGALANPSAYSVEFLRDLEHRATGTSWWVPAARAHGLCSPSRERDGFRVLASRQLPFALPGDLDPVVVHLLAMGERVLPALHGARVEKLTELATTALMRDLDAVGAWFWPVLQSLNAGRFLRALARLADSRGFPPGARGLVAAYRYRLGAPWEKGLDRWQATDWLLLSLAISADRSPRSEGPGERGGAPTG
ncbi:MAG: hypothetical protein QGG40_00755 [Myxococcota bacterium]|jgi:hypothetical protein|nr:hypothetical protein [Myxococcota bacterium]